MIRKLDYVTWGYARGEAEIIKYTRDDKTATEVDTSNLPDSKYVIGIPI